jgi:hypothetical protein
LMLPARSAGLGSAAVDRLGCYGFISFRHVFRHSRVAEIHRNPPLPVLFTSDTR